METLQKPAKKKHRGRTALLVLCIVLLLLVGVPLLYVSCFGFACDDGEALAASEPMPVSERYTFDAAARSMDVAVDTADLWFFINSSGSMEPVLSSVEETLAPMGLTLRRMGFSFTEQGASLTAKLLYGGFLPLPVRADFSLETENGSAIAKLTRVWLGRLISLDAETLREKFSVDESMTVFSLELGELHSRLAELISVRTEAGRLVLTLPVGDAPVREMLDNFDIVSRAADYLGDFEAVAVAKSVFDGDYKAYDALLTGLAADPGHYAEFRKSALAAAEDFVAKTYLGKAENKLLARFLPEVNAESVSALSAVYEADRAARETAFLALNKRLEQKYIAREIAATGTGFTDLASGGAALTLEHLAGSDWPALSAWLSESETRIIYGLGGNYYQVEPLEALRGMPKADESAFSGLKQGEIYVLLLMTRLASGRPVLAYYTNGGKLVFTELPESQFAEFLGAERTPVYELGLTGTYDLG